MDRLAAHFVSPNAAVRRMTEEEFYAAGAPRRLRPVGLASAVASLFAALAVLPKLGS